MCGIQGTSCLVTPLPFRRRDPNVPLLLPRITEAGARKKKRKRNLKKQELKKHQSEIQEAHVEKWLESTARFPKKRWKIEQKRSLKIWFERLDTNGSGEIDVDELADPLMSTGLAGTMAEVTSLIHSVDGNKSSGIDFGEFLGVMKGDGKTDTRVEVSKKSSTCAEIVEKVKFAGYGPRRKKQGAGNPIMELTNRQKNEHLDLKSVLSRERRKLLLDATMLQAQRRERAHEQINRWRSEMDGMKGASKFRKLQDISTLIQRLETDRVEKDNFVEAMKGVLDNIQAEGDGNQGLPVSDDGRFIKTPAHQALMKQRNVSLLRRDREMLIGAGRKALVYPRTRNPSLPSLLGIRHGRTDFATVRLPSISDNVEAFS